MDKNIFTRHMLHYTAVASATAGAVFVLNNFLTFIFELPGLYGFLNQFGADLDFPTKQTFINFYG
ncbi:MAG: hypothetical protein VXW18_09540 [Pseudomonadota bacterium]|nr:hypothetical protein [Pseudomonadota bacterium]